MYESEHIKFVIINTYLNRVVRGYLFDSIDEGEDCIDELDDDDLSVIPCEAIVH